MDKDEKISTIIYSFREVNKFFYRQMWQHANELGITIVQLQILKIIDEEPNMSLLELTKKMNVNKSTVSSTIERLVKAGYIEREQSEKDRRAIVLNLTEIGKERQKEGHTLFYERLKHLDEISDEDVNTLLDLHQLVKEKIQVTGDEKN
ncbi:DNA-binding MarR family transcriptional regulator [Virgibacillus natechei]|uniref:DNA-binding MarR family transcriptional regulator n=1 Tax=Virgibacillus natechei TaxID=1216297 RepID=A0ABS4IHE9_9BACI|nr:MarR family transcriptional regulator [Virgibacillus natechei]MBP1970379.1 DNA-binding MarR family transcriptional regulator [Virgibacillus natechei]UZD13202.1 MarR family transcriptional regulator [Virgibacillus natechei]